MNKLVWQLFEMLREVMPPSAENTKRFAEWAQAFRAECGDPAELEGKAEHAKAEEDPDPPFDPDQEDELEELDESPHRPSKKKRL
jgi:hypothetical protein